MPDRVVMRIISLIDDLVGVLRSLQYCRKVHHQFTPTIEKDPAFFLWASIPLIQHVVPSINLAMVHNNRLQSVSILFGLSLSPIYFCNTMLFHLLHSVDHVIIKPNAFLQLDRRV